MLRSFARTVLATVEEDDEEFAAGHGDRYRMHEHLVRDTCNTACPTATHAGSCRGNDEAGKMFCDAAEARRDPDVRTNNSGAQARPAAPAHPQAAAQRHKSKQLLSATPWPADRLVCGALEVRGSATGRTRLDRKVKCTIQHGVITFYDPAETGAEAVILAREQVSSIVATIVPDQTRKFSICSGLELIDSTQVWCCAKDQADRNQWLAVLHRLGVDIYFEDSDGEIRRVRQGVQAKPGRTDV
jgi:hypothetical protein